MDSLFTVEELKTSIGCIMKDLATCWEYQYSERVEELHFLLITLIEIDTVDSERLKEYEYDLDVTVDEMGESEDGTVFESCYLYSYCSKDGMTKRVKEHIYTYLTSSDNSFKLETP